MKRRNPMDRESLITGCWIHGREVVTHRFWSVEDPAERAVIARVHTASEEEVNQAVCSSAQAFANWRMLSPEKRSELIKKWAELLKRNAERLSEVLSLEVGKPIRSARSEVVSAADFLDYCATEGIRISARYSDSGFIVIREPVGICGIITPYNYPLSTLAVKVGPALMAGCTAIVKPDEHTPLSSLMAAKLALDAGIPPGVINVLCGPGEEAGRLLVRHPSVRLISFTGSTKVGKEIYAECSAYIKRVILELGGNCPAIIASDASWERHLDSITQQTFKNTGQYCYRITRIIVHKSIYESFTARFVEKTRNLRVGNPKSEETQLGPLNNLKIYENFRRQILSVLEHGGEMLLGEVPEETPSGGYFVRPVVFRNVPTSARIGFQEYFGPVAFIIPFSDDDEALELANDTIFGLAAYIFTEDYRRALRWSRNIEAGSIWVNRIHQARFDAPFGGFKQSGIGREKSLHGIEAFTELKTLYFKLDGDHR
ncbi:aldehyde dehydrogenase family protein [Thermodesulforhabdus norvegica]|uniref:Succinate-semialdehyde dehydrogenase / glutarate-semialdehyde dehydrogenase n=1 Tax=Thermodesulforhabdus norvegica TaxID=39841 RepID=A0A1I4SBK0_9BACT|nr:aldehyde dehydrogenase family protein [Thermodesulforhabdus norvegica]SFM61852.1 succinate-semialdehyde dehydrogenase / glutarate-semialdehyde dehydrogenase [Thermodesulforhabdus norvegica]